METLATYLVEQLQHQGPYLVEAMASAPIAPTAWNGKPAPGREALEPVGAVGSTNVR